MEDRGYLAFLQRYGTKTGKINLWWMMLDSSSTVILFCNLRLVKNVIKGVESNMGAM